MSGNILNGKINYLCSHGQERRKVGGNDCITKVPSVRLDLRPASGSLPHENLFPAQWRSLAFSSMDPENLQKQKRLLPDRETWRLGIEI